MSGFRVGVIQMNSGAEVAANLQHARTLLQDAANDGASLVVLPENFAAMGADDTCRISLAETDGVGPVQDFLAETAARLGVWVVGGSVPLKSADPERPYSSCLVFDDAGRRCGRYDKMHLFDVDVPGSAECYRESAATTPGAAPLRIDTPWGGLAVAICYDIRFPEMFRSLADYELLAVPAAFTRSTGEAHWRALLTARAIENQCFVMAAAQTGKHPGARATYGHSLVCGSWGETLAELSAATGHLCVDLNRDELKEQRTRFPALQHRRIAVGERATKSRD